MNNAVKPLQPPVEPAMRPQKDATILVVDDEPGNLGVLNALLQPYYRVRVARSGADALRAVATAPRPDLILLDVMMPEMDGYTVLAKLRESPAMRNIPVIFVTAMDTLESEQRGIEAGAVDYITKPISAPIVLARVRTQLELKSARDDLAGQNAHLEVLVTERTDALRRALNTVKAEHTAMKNSYFGTLMAIGALAALRGPSIGQHSRRVADMARRLARALGMSEADSQDIFVAALLHDIGKIGFPEEMLRKSVKSMNADELTLYRRHPVLGADALGKIDALAGIAAIVRHHHENFDGTGFPDGRSGLDIPLGARIVAAASDYDDNRHGSQASQNRNQKDALRFLIEGRGRRYDPGVVDQLEALLTAEADDGVDEIRVAAAHLQAGMILTRNVMHPEGFLLLSQNTTLEQGLIDQLINAQKKLGPLLEIFVKRQRDKPGAAQ